MPSHNQKVFSTERNLYSRLERVNGNEKFQTFHRLFAREIGGQNANVELFVNSFMKHYQNLPPTLRSVVAERLRDYAFYLTMNDISGYFAGGLYDALEKAVDEFERNGHVAPATPSKPVESAPVTELEDDVVEALVIGDNDELDLDAESENDAESSDDKWTYDSLQSLTVKKLLALADEWGYSLSSDQKANKASIVESLAIELYMAGQFDEELQ